jgi:hypothetical protein
MLRPQLSWKLFVVMKFETPDREFMVPFGFIIHLFLALK